MSKRIVIAFLLLTITILPGFSQTHVQTNTLFQTTTATTIARNFTAASTSGNLIVVNVDWDKQTVSVSSVTDNKGNTYTRINGPTNWNGVNYRAELWYAYNIVGGPGNITVTAHLSGAPTSFSQIYISEYSGIATTINPLDKNSVATGNTVAVSSGSATTVFTKELVYGASIGASGTLSVGAGFNTRSTANSNIIEDKNVAVAGTYNAAFTSASGLWVAQMAIFISTTSNAILPIDFLSFSGSCQSNHIELAWATSFEVNNELFVIERSEDATHWQDIGTKKGAGNSSTVQEYSFIADKSMSETSYFRLKQNDNDGKFIYSKIIQVNNCQKDIASTTIYPNPSNGISLSGKINLKINEPYTVDIMDHMGKVLSTHGFTQFDFTIRFLHTLPAGVYYARFTSRTISKVESFLVKP
jgi:hypothetical protein